MMRSSFILSLLGCLITASSVLAAEPSPEGDNHERKRDDIRFSCDFRGFHMKKEPLFCEAHGRIDTKIPTNHFITGDRDDFLIITCGNRVIYDSGVVYGLFSDRHSDHDLTHGDEVGGEHNDRNHDDEKDFFDIKILSITPYTAAIHVENASVQGFNGGSDRASLTVSLFDRVPVSLIGSCHFRHHRDGDDHDHDGNDHGHAPQLNLK